MKKLLFVLAVFFILSIAHGQTDSAKTQEISFGISIIPPLYPGFARIISGDIPSLGLNLMGKSYYSVPININYRFYKNNKGKNNLSFVAVVPVNDYSDFSYYAISYGKTIFKLNKKGTFSLNGDLLVGYLKYKSWGLGGMFTFPKFYKGADLLLTGFNIGLTAHHKLSSRLFLENEIYFLTYYTRGNLYYYDSRTYPTTVGTSKESKMGITFSKLLSVNIGYKF